MIMRTRSQSFPFWREVVLLALLGALLILSGVTDSTFLKPRAQIELSTHVWELALLALPMTLIIITAGIDLSIGSTMALSAVVLGLAFKAGIPPYAGAGLAILVGMIAGALNGIFVAYVRVHPLIVTLATLAAFRGVAEGISLGQPVSGFPASFGFIGQGSIGGIPVPGLIFGLAAIVTALLLGKTSFGRSLYAIGHNELASRLSGLSIERIKMLLYTLAGALAGVAAVLFVSRRNTAKADIGTGMELDVITAVVLGGASIFGGRGRILGTILGVLLIHETREFVSWHWNKDELNFVVLGLLLIVSVLADSLLSPKESE